MASNQKGKPDLLAALEAEPGGRGGKCMVCQLPYREKVDQALRMAFTGRWTIMRVLQEMQKTEGFKGGYNSLHKHARHHLGVDA